MYRLKSAGLEIEKKCSYNDTGSSFIDHRARFLVSPNILFDALVKLCKKINNLYNIVKIKDNAARAKLFMHMLSDLALGMKRLGLLEINKI